MRLYMVTEWLRPEHVDAIYARLRERGRLMPEGLEYVDSWVAQDRSVCYQLVRTDDGPLIDTWTEAWRDLVDFEIRAVDPSADVQAAMASRDEESSRGLTNHTHETRKGS